MQGSRRAAPPTPTRHLLLAGGGHTHALLLRRWLMQPRTRPAATRITLVNRRGMAFYSGLLPALVAGRVSSDEACIDLRRLCQLADVCFVQAEIIGLDRQAHELLLQGRAPLRFDVLSLDVGAVVAMPAPPSASGPAPAAAAGQPAQEIPPAAGQELPVKPLEPLLAWLAAGPPDRPLRLRGGGAAAVELALALKARGHACRLLLRGGALRLGHPRAARAAEQLLLQAGIPLQRHTPASEPADLACTGSRAPDWLAAAGLPVQEASGRVLTEATLQVRGHGDLFASGDCAVIAERPRPASGVWAVRAAGPLAVNLQRRLQHPEKPLQRWRPQRFALQLLGDPGPSPRAIASWGPLSWGPNRWLWFWKQSIDRRFIASFQRLAPPPDAPPMACRGCAAKLPARPLAGALARLPTAPGAPPADPTPEDAATVARLGDGTVWLQSVDGFPALVQDPWLNGRLTTLHACSDLWACAATVASAQVIVTVPEASPALQEELLLQTLAGVRSVLDPLAATLIGGHSLEGRDGAGLSLSLVINGRAAAGRVWGKGPLQPGDRLLLSRPIGSGVLFAAASAGAPAAPWLDAALAVLQRSQAPLVDVLLAHGARACTDVTGFGLLGHLGEMLAAGGIGGLAAIPAAAGAAAGPPPAADPAPPRCAVELDAASVPALPGSLELISRGFASSLAPANARALQLLEGPVRLASAPGESPLWQAARRELLIDPQTCGPLLAALPADHAEQALLAVRAAGFADAALIGRVVAAAPTRTA